MSSATLIGTYMRLRQELAQAYAAATWNEGRIDRLANEIAVVERALASALPSSEQTDGMMLGTIQRQGQQADAQGDLF